MRKLKLKQTHKKLEVAANYCQTEQEIQDCLDDMPVSQAPTQDMPPTAKDKQMMEEQPQAKKLTPARRPFTLPRTFGLGLYQNAATGVSILNPGHISQRVFSSPTWAARGHRKTGNRGKKN